ncbi:MAG: 2-dehydropantoate 2-reductase [Haliea sp.]|nr:2-dehydropantoate 2-reductase [Haliea sp.]
MQDAHWHVLGAGAIGCLFAQALHRSGSSATLVMRPGTHQRFLPLIVERGDQRCEAQLPVITAGDDELISHLLVTTKAYDVRAAVAGIAHLLNDDCVVLLLVNGMGLAEQLAADWPRLDIYCGTTTEGAYALGARHIRHAGRGQTRIGKTGLATPPPWFAQWSRAVDHCVWDGHIANALWAKLAVNCIINPLTAVHGCRNGELGQRRDLAEQVALLCDEVSSICRAAGFGDIAQQLPSTVAAVIAGTADNRSSMLQDVECERRTEIEYITGYLLEVADQLGIAAPRNRALLEEIQHRAH